MVEGIDSEHVTAWLAAQVPALTPPVSYALIAGGHSNLTYSARDAAGRVFVIRRPPLGHVLESAHDMGREYRIIHALCDSGVPVGREVRVRVLARDVSIANSRHDDVSIMNLLPATVVAHAAEDHPSQVLVQLRGDLE